MRSKLIILLFLITGNILRAYCQEIASPVNIQSPTVSSLIVAPSINVSNNQGTPNISIPLYNTTVKDIGVDFNLSYDASGIRINQHPGIVGLNWNLLCGGVISRSVQGSIDEKELNYSNNQWNEKKLGFLYRCGDINDLEEDINNQQNFDDKLSILQEYAYKANWGYDYEPDIFSFNFMGISGSFYMDNDGEWKVRSDNNVKVYANEELIPPLFENLAPCPVPPYQTTCYKTISGFTIIDERGNQYIFGGDQDAIEYSIDFFNQALGESWIANAWHLKKVIDPNGVVLLNFTYERKNFIASLYYNIYYKEYNAESINFTWRIAPECANSTWSGNINSYIAGSLISPVYLTNINSPYNDLDISLGYLESAELQYDKNKLDIKYNQVANLFPSGSYGNGVLYFLEVDNPYIDDNLNYFQNLKWYKLHYISIHSSLNRRIEFQYDNTSLERLNLQEIKIFDNTYGYGSPEHYDYIFHYNYDNNSLPPYLSLKEDHWGYNKGTNFNFDLLPLSTDHYQERQPSATDCLIGLLDKINWPTKGYTSFEYEPNNYAKYVSDDRSLLINETGLAGGVRIKKIISNDGVSDITKEYKYVTGFNLNHNSTASSGILTFKPKYRWDDWGIRYGIDLNRYYSQDVFSNNSLVPSSNYYGEHLNYSEIVEINGDNSYTINKYSNFDTEVSFMDDPPIISFSSSPNSSPFNKYNDNSAFRGKLLKTIDFTDDDKEVQEISYTYDQYFNGENHNFIVATNSKYFTLCSGSAECAYIGSAFKIDYSDYMLINKTVKNFDDNNQVILTETFDYDYNSNNLLQTETSTNSNGLSSTITYKYPDDYIADCEEVYHCQQIYENCLESAEAVYNAAVLSCNTLYPPNSSQLFECIGIAEGVRINAINNCNEAYNNCCTEGSTVEAIQILKDRHEIASLIEKTKRTDGKVVDGEVNEYDVFDQATVHLSKKHVFASDMPVITEGLSYIENDLSYFRTRYCNSSIIFDEWDNKGNLLQFHKAEDVKTNYLWGYNQSLPVALVRNAEFKEYDFAGFEHNEAIGWQIYSGWTYTDDPLKVKTGESAIKVLGYGPSKYFDIGTLASGHSGYKATIWVKGGTDAYIRIQVNDDYSLSKTVYNSNNPSGDWNLLEVELPYQYYVNYINSTMKIKVYCGSSSTACFDDLRFYPMDAEMTTFTYKPLIGITSASDVNNKPTYYEYDAFGRLSVIKDYLGNILKKFDYHYRPQ